MSIAVGRDRSFCLSALIPETEPGFFEVLTVSDMGLSKHLATAALLKMEMRQDIICPQWACAFDGEKGVVSCVAIRKL